MDHDKEQYMGTRGAIGFRFRETDKVTYNHFDSYPTGIGGNVLRAVKDFNDEQIAGAANRIEMVDEDVVVTPELVERYAQFHNSAVSTGQVFEWYSLLRDVQGELAPYIDGKVDHMIEYSAFLRESLFCEWAYILNADTRKVEFYRGFNEAPGKAGRYAEYMEAPSVDHEGKVWREPKYYGVALVFELPFDVVRDERFDIERFCSLFETYVNVSESPEDYDSDKEYDVNARNEAAAFLPYMAQFARRPEAVRDALGWSEVDA